MIAPAQKQIADLFTEHRLFSAWEAVAARHSAPGYDHVTVEEFSRNSGPRLHDLRDTILRRQYTPSPLVSFYQEKSSGGTRCLNIATVRDRVVCRVLADALVERHDRDLQPQCYAYRPHRGALKAVSAVQRACREYEWVARTDISEFFETLDHGIIDETLEARGWSEPVVSMVQALAKAPRFDGVRLHSPAAGVPMGLPIAPVISNLYLDAFDIALNDAKLPFLRYADDIVIFARSDADANSALAEVRLQLDNLKLAPSVSKTRIYRCADGFLFLGFLFRPEGHVAGHEAQARLRAKLDEPMCGDETLAEFSRRRESIRRGWHNYYGGEAAGEERERRREIEDRRRNIKPPSAGSTSSAVAPDTDDVQIKDIDSTAGDPPASAGTASQPLIEECTTLCTAGRHAEAVYILRRVLGDDENGLNATDRGQLRRLLADAYDAMGLTGASRCCRQTGEDGRELVFSDKDGVAGTPEHGARDVEQWLEVFGGDDIRVARQFVDRLGRHGYRPATHGLGAKDLQRHWDGKETLAVPVYRAADSVRFGVLDLDITRNHYDRMNAAERKILLERMLDDGRHLLERAAQAGIKGILEDSGCKGYHVWFLLHAPLDAALVRTLLSELCRVAGPPPEGSHRELFPASDHCPPETIGRYIKLPLGVHRLTARRSRFLAPDGTPCANGVELLAPSFRNRAADLRAAVERWNRYRAEPDTGGTPAAATAPRISQPTPSVCSRAVNTILEHCTVLQGLRRKALQEEHLSHAEHSVLRGVLAAVEDGGREAIHDILSHCRNYSRSVTDRFILHPQVKPMGCMRIREILGEFCNETGCDCRFRTRKSDYPHPLRWLDAASHRQGDSTPCPGAESGQVTPHTETPHDRSLPYPHPTPNPDTVSLPVPTTIPQANEEPTDDVAALLTRFHKARKELIEAQALLMAATEPPAKAILPFGTVRCGDADPAIFRWTVET